MKENLQGVDPITNGEDHTNGGVNTKSSGDPAQSETPRTSRNIMHENRETWSASAAQFGGRPVGEGQGRTTYRHAGQESDSGVVPMKGSNKEGQPTAESLEGRPETKENDRQRHMRPTQCGTRMSQGLKGVRLGRLLALTPFIQGKSRMRETRSYGSVRGVPGDRHPYRDLKGVKHLSLLEVITILWVPLVFFVRRRSVLPRRVRRTLRRLRTFKNFCTPATSE